MPDLAEQLRAVVDGSADPITMDEIRGERELVLRAITGGPRRGRGWLVGALVAAAAIVVAIVVATRPTGPDVDPTDSVVAPVTSVAPTSTTAAPTASEPITNTTAATTTTAAVPAGDRWQDMAPAPIRGRGAAFTVWTGKQLVIWGGGANSPPSDGAAYDPATDTWRMMAPIPGNGAANGPAAVWTGKEALFLKANTMDPPPQLAAYDPAADSWRILPSPFSQGSELVSVWTGREMLLFGTGLRSNPALPTAVDRAFNPSTGQWRSLSGLGLPQLAIMTATWVGNAVILTGSRNDRGFIGSYDPVRGVLTALTALDLPFKEAVIDPPVAVVGDELLFFAGFVGSRTVRYFNPTTNTWRTGAAPPCTAPENSGTRFGGKVAVYVGGLVLFDCADGPVAVYDPATNTWTTRDFGTSSLGRVTGSSVAVIGSTLYLWGGFDDSQAERNVGVRLTITRA